MICIYHYNCTDGFGAAWALRKAIDNVTFIGGTHGEPPPDVTDQDVFLVDFSYKRPIILELAKRAKSIIIIDHHISSEQDLIDLPNNVTTIFDSSHSGAILTWNYFFPSTDAPQLLKHIEDRDILKLALPNTTTIQSSLFSYPYDFELWDNLMNMPVESLHHEGVILERKHNKDIEELLKIVTRPMIIGGHRVNVANLPYTMCTEAGLKLAQGMPFGATYYDMPDKRAFSLRSTADGINVSEIAKLYGGGGHVHAAGFKVDYNIARTFEII